MNKVEHDFGIDFRVEVAAAGKLRGCDFFVQVKGFSDSPGNRISHRDIRVRCATARYWKEKLLPVMIVAINVNTAKGNFVWFDKALQIPTDQDTISIPVPLDRDELLPFKIIYSLAPFWEQWVEQIQDEAKVAVYRKLLSDTLGATRVLLDTYDALLFAPPGLLDEPDVLNKARDEAVKLCYMIVTKWIHDVNLYTSSGLGTTQLDQQIRLMIERSRRALESVIAPVGESGGFGVMLMNPTKAIPQLPLFRRIFLEIIDFLSRQVVASTVR